MIYRIVLDGVDIYGATSDTAIIDPTVNIELNTAGSCDFAIPPTNKYYDLPNLLTSDVEIYEENELIWFGRILEMNTNLNLEKDITCEGPLAYFNDSIQRPQIFDTTTVHEFFEDVIDAHNAQVPANRRFTVGEITVDDIEIYRELNYETTKDVLTKMCVGAEGGYLFFRKVNGENYIDWLSGLQEIGTQPVQFGLNIVDISKHIKASELITSIIPLGKEIDGVKVTISDVHGGIDYLDSDLVDLYGKVTAIVEFNNISTPAELLLAATRWLENNIVDPLTIKCDAAELHYLKDYSAYQPFKVGQKVRVVSNPHLIDKELPITSMSINLDSAVKKVSIGTPEKQDLTEIYKPND